MRLGGSQTTYPCEEFGEVAVPLSDLLTNGELDIYPEVASRGYFDIAYRRGSLILNAKRFVGLIPISDKVAIHVHPRAPIANLMWLIWRSGAKLPRLEGVIRGYATRSGDIDTPEALYVDVFVGALEKMASGFVLKRYRRDETENEWNGRLNISRSVGRFYSRGVKHRHVFEPTELTADNLENQIIKHTAVRLLRHLGQSPTRTKNELARRLSNAIAPLRSVDDRSIYAALIAKETPRLLRGLSAAYAHYETPLWLAYLIATNSGVVVERFGPTRLESLVINVAEVFEAYVRRVCVEAQRDVLDCRVEDGNERPLRLFAQGGSFPIKPDIYFVRGGTIPAVADAKYKQKPSEEDRYALLAYCEATGAQRGAFILPAEAGRSENEYSGTSLGGKRIEVIRVNLAAPDLRVEEARFLTSIGSLLGVPALPAVANSAKLFDGKVIDYPTTSRVNRTYKQAPGVLRKVAEAHPEPFGEKDS